MDTFQVPGSLRSVTPSDVLSNVLNTEFGGEFVSFVTEDFALTPNYGVPEVDVEPGIAYISTGEDVVQIEPEDTETLSLTDSATNYIYIRQDIRGVEYAVITPSEETPRNSVKIGEVDTVNDQTRNVFKGPKMNGLPSSDLNGVLLAREEDGYDIFDAINRALEAGGEDTTVFVKPAEYREDGSEKAISTQMQSTASGQTVKFLGADVGQADGADLDSLIHVKHDGFTIESGLFLGNQANNPSTNTIYTTDTGLVGLSVEECEAQGVPVGFEFNGARDSKIDDLRVEDAEPDLGTPIKFDGCTACQVISSSIRGFNTYGVNVVNSTSIDVTTTEIGGTPGESPTAAVRFAGVDGSKTRVVVDGNGEIAKGLLVEAYDPGGANEKLSTDNDYNITCNGVTDIGVHVRDSVTERVRGVVFGDYDTGRTTQAFLVDKPNGLGEAAHDIMLTIDTVTRISDTSLSGGTAGVKLAGHVKQVSDVSNITAAGTSVLNFTFGNGVNQPAINAGNNTTVVFNQNTKKATTGGAGQVNVDWSSFYHFTERPVLTASLESNNVWYVTNYGTDGSGRYTDADIQVTDLTGAAVGAGVQVNIRVEGT